MAFFALGCLLRGKAIRVSNRFSEYRLLERKWHAAQTTRRGKLPPPPCFPYPARPLDVHGETLDARSPETDRTASGLAPKKHNWRDAPPFYLKI